MTTTRDDVRPHHKTVTKFSERQGGRKRPSKLASRPLITTLRVDPRILKIARELAGGNVRRIEVRSYTCVVVKNHRVR